MAQIGCYIPASKCRMTPFDRIFTRIGANDNIMSGQSTFMVELVETCRILQDATPRSLVILDELGRGTSTFDGYAIAYAVLYHLLTQVQCLGLFSTHYGSLTRDFEFNSVVKLMFMSFFVDQESQQVTFLYKLLPGVSPDSYGMNVARMANIPDEIVSAAENVSLQFDVAQEQKRLKYSNLSTTSLCDLTAFASLFRADKASQRISRCLQ